MEIQDTYKTIAQASEEILFKEKNSKFFGYAFPIESEEELKPIVDNLKKLHPTAGHFCYAYQLGIEKIIYRANDDGEPSTSAGMPIYGQLQSFGVTNTLIIVVRLFGGIKLGVGGLISAYKTAAQLSLEHALIIEKTINVTYLILFEYKNINKVMRIIKEKNLDIVSQKMEMSCEVVIKTRKKNAELIFSIFDTAFEIDIKIIE